MGLCNNEITEQTFDNFYIDKSNRLAYDIIRDITISKKIKDLPVLVMGKSGVGKSHLMKALENSIKEKVNVIRISSDEFTQNDYIINYKTEDITVLIIEDIEFLSSKRMVQKKVYNILRELKAKNTKIILTAGIEKLHLKELDFIEEMKYKKFKVIEISDKITSKTRRKIIQDYVIINGIELCSSEIHSLIIENNTFIELKSKLNAAKAAQHRILR